MIGAGPARPSEVKAWMPAGLKSGSYSVTWVKPDWSKPSGRGALRARAGALQLDVGDAVEVHVVEEQLAHVVGDDVDHHQHVAVVRGVDKRAQVVEVAEVGVRRVRSTAQ
jgi:hypothetical protein